MPFATYDRTGVFMQKLIISLICCLLPAFAIADTLAIPNNAQAIRDDAPDSYVVAKGDTLWDISAKFFKDPWKWPQIWGLNKDTIKNPHWIYPGDVVVLDRTAGMLKVEGQAGPVPGAPEGAASQVAAAAGEQPSQPQQGEQPGNVVKLSPSAHPEKGELEAIPTIPLADIRPFLQRPLLINNGELGTAPTIVSTYESRVILGTDDVAYVEGMPENKGAVWQVYRKGKALIDPVTEKKLGTEVTYLGTARVEKFGKISTIRITNAVQEIRVGDQLIQVGEEFPSNFVPRAPEKAISASVISLNNGIYMAGQRAVVSINKGAKDGVENGHVLALYRKGARSSYGDKKYTLPNVRYGLLFIFRTYANVSYGIVMTSQLPVEVLDIAQTP